MNSEVYGQQDLQINNCQETITRGDFVCKVILNLKKLSTPPAGLLLNSH